nr:MAG TPA: hypothetical protein [Caudoviricetes sp.]
MQNAGGNIHVPSDEVTEWAVGIFSTPYDSRILSH